MKKRLLSALLALALVFVLLPTTALADTTPVTDENVKINGTPVTVGNNNSLGEGNGTYSYDKATHTLTLNSATINATDSNIGIEFCDTTNYVTYSVILTGENTVTSNNIAIETTPNTNLTFTGGGNLKAITNGYYQAIRVYGTLTIENSTLIAESSAYTATTVIWTLAMTGNNAKLEISNKSAANIVAGTAGPASNIDWSNYQFTTGSYSGDALTESDPEVCSWGTLKKYFGYPTKEYSQYICIAKRTIALETTSDVRIAGDPAVVGVETSIPSANGSGTYYYDQASKTLTLKDVNIASSSIINAIQFTADGTYTIKLEGTNTISDVSNGIFVTDDKYITSLNVTITGVGSLDISAKGLAIGMKKGDLNFENTGAIKLSTGNIGLNNNALSVKGNITITDMSKYSVTGTQQTGGTPLGSEVSLTEASQLKGGTTGYRIITITPAALEKSNVYVAGTNLYKNTAYTIQNGKPVMGGTYPGNYNIYLDATNYVLHVKDAVIDATGTTGIYGTSNIVFEGTNSITASSYGIYSYFTSSDLKISGTGSLTVKTKASCPAIATVTNYTPKPSIEISGQGFTVTADTSGTTSPAITSAKDLTVKDGVTVKAASNATRAIDITGNLTVNSGATLTATSKSDSVPTVQVGGNASFTGSTVTITNNSTELHKDAADDIKGDSVSSALYVKGNINTDNANVTAKVENGGGNAIGALGNITVKGSSNVTAVNKGQKFTTIIAKYVYVSGDSKITANNLNKNLPHKDSYLAFPAIEGKIVNQNTDYSLKFEGQHNGTSVPKTTLAPGEQTTLYYYNVTITRGDKVARTPSHVVIAGTTLLNDTYYTITNDSTVVANGSESNYNAFYDSEAKTLKLNNAKISTTTGTAIKIEEDLTITVTGTNELNGNYNHCIESDNNFKINGTGRLVMTNGSNTDASVIYCGPGKSLTIAAEVIIKNAAQPGKLIHTVKDDAYSFAEGYNVYASTEVSGSPLETYDAAKGSTYKYLRITKENLAPTTPTPQTPFTIYGIPAQFVDGGMIATTGVTATSSNNINLPIDRVKWYTFTPVFGSDGRMDSVSDKTEATGNFEAGKYYVVEIKFVQDLSPFKSWDMKVSGWSDNDVYRQSVTARNDIEIYFLTPASAATHEHNWAENYDPVYHWKMCTYDGCTVIKDKALHVWNAWHTSNNEQQHSKSCSECSYSTPPHDIDLAYVSDGEQGHHLYCKHDGCTFVTGTTAHVYAEGSNICTDCGYNKSAPCDHTGDRAYTNNGDGTHKVTCKACGATIVEKQSHEFGPTGACIYCGATQSGGDPTPDNPGTIVIIRPAEEEKPAQQPNPSTGANDLVGLAVAAAVVAALGSAALLRKHD